MKLTDQEIAKVEKGEVVVRILPSETQEIAVFGIVRIRASANFFVDRFRDIERYKKNAMVPAVKKFSSPPRIEDLQQLAIDDDDVNALKKCKVGNCDVKLPRDTILRLQKEIDWRTPDARQKATELIRTMLLDYVQRYLIGGNQELNEYNDKKQPLRLAEEFDSIMDGSPYVFEYVPEFYEYLHDYPKKKLGAVEDFLYWSKENLGLKPIISVTHVNIYQRPDSGVTYIASKQLYASHYFEASLGLTVAVQADGAPTPAFYLMYFNRSRSDSLDGVFGGIARNIVKGRTRSGMLDNLEKVRSTIEAQIKTSATK